MPPKHAVTIVGMGEVGKPLSRILSRAYEVICVDIAPIENDGPGGVLHICYPFQITNFVKTTADYVKKYRPALTIINSTVPPGTTRNVQALVGSGSVVYSPVRGKHAHMEADMLKYKKFVAGFTEAATADAIQHFEGAGFRTGRLRTPEIAELSKLVETTWLGVLVAWAQEVERFAASYDASFGEVNEFIKEIEFLPSHIFPGHIGGHCVMPNIALLQMQFRSSLLDAIVSSNRSRELADAA